jgi:hypothetical protein
VRRHIVVRTSLTVPDEAVLTISLAKPDASFKLLRNFKPLSVADETFFLTTRHAIESASQDVISRRIGREDRR